MWSLVTVMRNCGIQLFQGTVKYCSSHTVCICCLYDIMSLQRSVINACNVWLLNTRIIISNCYIEMIIILSKNIYYVAVKQIRSSSSLLVAANQNA